MQIVECGDSVAVCEGMGTRRQIDTLLIGDQPMGTWVLVFMQSAQQVLSPGEAKRMTDALAALDAVMQQGATDAEATKPLIDTLFADLAGREPPKPPSLIELEKKQCTNNQT